MVPKILQLLASNQKASIRVEWPAAPQAAAGVQAAATLYVYGPIGWYGVTANDFAGVLAELAGMPVQLRINSPGGDVMEARAIHTLLKAHNAPVTATVDGLAASAASFLMLAASSISIAPGAFVMIHNPWTIAVDDAEGLRRTADLLDKVTGTIAEDYAAKCGRPLAELVTAMAEETWFTGREAVEYGLCDTLTEEDESEGEASMPEDPEEDDVAPEARAFNLAAYAKAPKALTEPPAAPAVDPAAALAVTRADALRRLEFYERTAL